MKPLHTQQSGHAYRHSVRDLICYKNNSKQRPFGLRKILKTC